VAATVRQAQSYYRHHSLRATGVHGRASLSSADLAGGDWGCVARRLWKRGSREEVGGDRRGRGGWDALPRGEARCLGCIRGPIAADGGKSQHEGLWRESALAAEAYEDVYN